MSRNEGEPQGLRELLHAVVLRALFFSSEQIERSLIRMRQDALDLQREKERKEVAISDLQRTLLEGLIKQDGSIDGKEDLIIVSELSLLLELLIKGFEFTQKTPFFDQTWRISEYFVGKDERKDNMLLRMLSEKSRVIATSKVSLDTETLLPYYVELVTYGLEGLLHTTQVMLFPSAPEQDMKETLQYILQKEMFLDKPTSVEYRVVDGALVVSTAKDRRVFFPWATIALAGGKQVQAYLYFEERKPRIKTRGKKTEKHAEAPFGRNNIPRYA